LLNKHRSGNRKATAEESDRNVNSKIQIQLKKNGDEEKYSLWLERQGINLVLGSVRSR